uniref:Uncharacterized protein n=1 Tax=Oryza nivara TaxID=4536 RepID=A0A0E0J0S0_ORYNI
MAASLGASDFDHLSYSIDGKEWFLLEELQGQIAKLADLDMADDKRYTGGRPSTVDFQIGEYST